MIAGRRPQGQALLDLVRSYQQRAGVTPETDNVRITDPEHEKIYPPIDSDDPDGEGFTRW